MVISWNLMVISWNLMVISWNLMEYNGDFYRIGYITKNMIFGYIWVSKNAGSAPLILMFIGNMMTNHWTWK
jgi:hypothetical protein